VHDPGRPAGLCSLHRLSGSVCDAGQVSLACVTGDTCQKAVLFLGLDRLPRDGQQIDVIWGRRNTTPAVSRPSGRETLRQYWRHLVTQDPASQVGWLHFIAEATCGTQHVFMTITSKRTSLRSGERKGWGQLTKAQTASAYSVQWGRWTGCNRKRNGLLASSNKDPQLPNIATICAGCDCPRVTFPPAMCVVHGLQELLLTSPSSTPHFQPLLHHSLGIQSLRATINDLQLYS
jgi:hypothetical protein